MKRTIFGITAGMMAIFVMVIGGVDNIARSQSSLPAPSNVSVANGNNPGEVVVSWDEVNGAAFYRVGWVALDDYDTLPARELWPYEDFWLEVFRFVDIGNRGQTSHTLTLLTPGKQYNFIVASNDTRYGAPAWSGWAGWLELTPLLDGQSSAGISPPQTTEGSTGDEVAFDGSRYESISSGSLHTCGVRVDGTVSCFGSNGRGQSSPPDGEFLSVSGGGGHTCGVKTDGTAVCWGSTAVPSPPSDRKFSSVSSGNSHACGVTPRDEAGRNQVICWGVAGAGRTDDVSFYTARYVSTSSTAESVSVGKNHNCALRAGGYIRCWGSNESAQLVSSTSAKAVSAGGEHTCWLDRNGTVGCRGSDTSGQSSPPTVPEGDFDQELYTYTELSAGGAHTCAINGDGNATQAKGTVRCWGSNLYGQSTQPSGVFDSISAGEFHTCGLRQNGTVACWGDNSYGQTPR